MEYIYYTLETIFIIVGGVSLIGYVLYKGSKDISSWEDGVKAIPQVFIHLYYFLSDNQSPQKIVNSALILTNKEAVELTNKFSNHPYNTPLLVSYQPNINGISWYDISAIGLISTYEHMSNGELSTIAYHIIQNFLMESREIQAAIFIKVASPTRLYFAIALSEEGRKFLEKQESEKQAMEKPTTPKPLEETVDIFIDSSNENTRSDDSCC